MRKRYLDLLRLFCVFLLIPFHTMMMYNSFGEAQYVYGVPLTIANWCIWLTYPWYMPLMFVIAGMSTRYSLQKRLPGQYITERYARIGLPLLSGVLLLNPFMAYIADIINNGYSGGYLAHYAIYFTRWTDLSGYDGGFGPYHLWFMLYLLIISLSALPVFLLCKRFPKFMDWYGWPITLLIVLGALQAKADDWISFGGKSLAQYFLLFLIGLFVLSHEEVQARLERYRFWLLSSALALGTGYACAIRLQWHGFINDLFYYAYGYIALLAFLGLGRRYLNMQNKALTHATENSQLYYILHYPILVAVAYVLLPYINNIFLQMTVIIAVSFVLTFAVAEIVRRIPIVRVLFGVKSSQKKN